MSSQCLFFKYQQKIRKWADKRSHKQTIFSSLVSQQQYLQNECVCIYMCVYKKQDILNDTQQQQQQTHLIIGRKTTIYSPLKNVITGNMMLL